MLREREGGPRNLSKQNQYHCLMCQMPFLSLRAYLRFISCYFVKQDIRNGNGPGKPSRKCQKNSLSQFHLIGSSSYHYQACLKFELDNTLVMMEKLMLPPISNNILLLQYLPISVVIEDSTWKQTFLVLNLIFGH